jgi:hypothetical protein
LGLQPTGPRAHHGCLQRRRGRLSLGAGAGSARRGEGSGPYRRRASRRTEEGQRGQAHTTAGTATGRRVGARRTAARRSTASARVWRGEGASRVGKVRGDLGRRAGGSDTEVAGAGARQEHGGGRRRGGRARERALAKIYSECPCLTAIFSRNLNRSAQCGQQESFRSSYPLQLL